MIRTILTISLFIFSVINLGAQSVAELKIDHKSEAVLFKSIIYTTGGFAQVEIGRPIQEVFDMITNVNTWPQINLGVTKAITPEDLQLAKGVVFKETISSPIPGFADWTNEWLVEVYESGKKFVISGRDNFAKTPIYSRITYTFSKISETKTLFHRKIEVSLDDNFAENSSRDEMEALYRFLGSQWEMAKHLKAYVENNSK